MLLVNPEPLELFDVLLFDEVSHFAQSSAVSLNLYKKENQHDEKGKVVDIKELNRKHYVNQKTVFDEVIYELDYLEDLYKSPSSTVIYLEFRKIVEKFVEIYRVEVYDRFINQDSNERISIKFDNFMSLSERQFYDENFVIIYKLIEKYAIDRNILLTNLETIILLLKYECWWVQNTPSNDYAINVNVYAPPDFVNIVNFVEKSFKGQVLCTDATFPFLPITKLFKLNWEFIDIGDPLGTHKKTTDYK